MRASASLKRRRSWLEIGIAGCSLLASPAEAAWPSVGAVWRSFTQAPVHYFHRSEVLLAQGHGNHHGTRPSETTPLPSLRGSSSHPTPSRQRQPRQQHSHNHLNPNPALLIEDTSLPPTREQRALEVEIAVHGRHGDWQACSPETCTQTRLVFCETLDSRIIVANDLCGDELPEAEQACVGEDVAAVCKGVVSSVVSVDGKQKGGNAGVDHAPSSKKGAPSPSPSAAADKKPQNSAPDSLSARGPARVAATPATTPGVVSHEAASSSKTSEAADAGGATAVVAEEVEVPVGGKGDKSEEGAATSGSAPAAAAAAAADPPTAKKTGSAAAEPREDAGAREEAKAAGHQQQQPPYRSSGKSSPPKQEPGSEPSAGAPPHQEEPAQPVLARIGGTASKSSRAEYRFWMVLAIGAGAVGSFMAVVVFAVGQYRKEQHRLRGIMALNEFPQDNYINPFARQLSSELHLSEDDRSAFKL